MPHSTPPIYLGRQPILDRREELVGFELLFRDSSHNAAHITGATRATATVVAHAFTELGIGNALGCLDAYLNVDGAFLLDDAIELLPPDKVILEILESVVATPRVVERCRHLRELGFRIALDDVGEAPDQRAPLFEFADILKIDLALVSGDRLPAAVETHRRPNTKLLAEKISQHEQFKHCADLGFDLFQGYYFARPAILKGRKLDSSKVVLMRLLSQTLADADTPVLEASFKQAPGLTINLLRLVNSVASGLRVKISSLRHAITVLGRRQLQRWLQLLLYTDPTGSTRLTNPLLQLAATRGRVMEGLAKTVASKDDAFSDHAFVCGVMSLTPALLDMPLAQILEQVSLAQPIADALLEGKGRLGQMLSIVEAMEGDDTELIDEKLLALPMLHIETLTEALAEAMRWANHIGEESDEA